RCAGACVGGRGGGGGGGERAPRARGASGMSPAELSRDAIRAIDPKDMLGDVLEQPAHLRDALWRVESADIKRFEAPGGLAICGMGGSGIGADLAIAAIGDRAKRPI